MSPGGGGGGGGRSCARAKEPADIASIERTTEGATKRKRMRGIVEPRALASDDFVRLALQGIFVSLPDCVSLLKLFVCLKDVVENVVVTVPVVFVIGPP